MARAGIATDQIDGYSNDKITHSAVAQVVAEGHADAGIGLEASAISYGLDFICLTLDRYDLVIPEAVSLHPAIKALLDWLGQAETRTMIETLGGNDVGQTGQGGWAD